MFQTLKYWRCLFNGHQLVSFSNETANEELDEGSLKIRPRQESLSLSIDCVKCGLKANSKAPIIFQSLCFTHGCEYSLLSVETLDKLRNHISTSHIAGCWRCLKLLPYS